MNSVRTERYISKLLLLYFLALFFYGVIIKVTFSNPVLFRIKTYVPELLLACVCMCCLCKPIKVWQSSFLMMADVIFVLVLNIFTSFSASSALMTVRDVFIPLMTGVLLCGIKLSDYEGKWFLNKLSLICMIALVCGLVLGVFQYIKGWQWTSAWYTGYSFWGEDKRSSLYIMGNGLHVRVPSIVGHNVKFGMYSFFQYLIIACNENNNVHERSGLKKCIFAIIMLTNIYISNNKTTIVIVFILLTIWAVNKFEKHSKIIILCFAIVCGIYVYIEILSSSEFMLSFYDRFSKWSVLKDPNLLKNILVPISTYNFAGNSETEISVLNYWDNTYLYFLFSFGIIGTVLVISWLKTLYNQANSINHSIVFYLTIFAAIAAATTSIVLGRCFFSIYVIMMAYMAAIKRGQNK
mgnify:CR=1 FL=1